MRYLTLAAVRALECNGCGDCCDSRRTDGFWTWPGLPEDRFTSIVGEPLITPLERVEGGWTPRAWREEDALELSGTRFQCAAFRPQEDGRGLCGRHDQPRPPICGQFPVWGPLEDELAREPEVPLQTGSLPRCTWYGMTVVRDDDPRAEAANGAVSSGD